MRLNTKFTLYFALSKLILFGLFLLVLPFLFNWYSRYTIDSFLHSQQHKVFDNIRLNGLGHYLQGESTYGSYTMLKEDYVAIQSVQKDSTKLGPAIINIERRVVDNDTIDYRILHRFFEIDGQLYSLEIGRSQSSISIYADILQQVALGILVVLLLVTISIDYFYGRHLLRPLQDIIRIRLTEQSFPFQLSFKPIKTSTVDFRLLDDKLCELMKRATLAYVREKEFTANASHELLTPISILRGKIENMLLLESLSAEAQERLLSSMRTLERLNGIVRTLLFLARVDSGQYQRKDTVLMASLLHTVCEELFSLMEEKDIVLSVEIPSTLHIIKQHQQLIFQLFYNLINNAVQYNRQKGWIRIIGRESLEYYIIDIADNGVGMSEEQVGKLFDRFQTKQSNGHGLGLSIVKSIANFLNIEIRISSSEKHGTTISLLFEKELVGYIDA